MKIYFLFFLAAGLFIAFGFLLITAEGLANTLIWLAAMILLYFILLRIVK